MRCPKHCLTLMELTDWEPPKGLDPELREFRCPRCGTRLYEIPRGRENNQEVKHVKLQNSKT